MNEIPKVELEKVAGRALHGRMKSRGKKERRNKGLEKQRRWRKQREKKNGYGGILGVVK